MASSTVEKIKDRLDVVEVVGSYLQLQKAGVNFKAKCPFHNERTPSFLVSPGRGTFYCFGCHEKGDIFSFVEKFEGTDFKGALKILADRAGVVLEKENKKLQTELEGLYKILEKARGWYVDRLSGSNEVKEYLVRRGLTAKTIKDWSLGFAVPEWRALYAHFKSNDYKDEELLKTGLIKHRDETLGKTQGEKYYDTFRGRVMFPIFESGGKVVGFSGRTLSKDPNTPKYINSPETPLFNKSELLYGLDKAKAEIRKKNYAILVEGQMDLLMCHQAGFKNTVASSGTALTSGHILKLKKLSPRIILSFDSDAAGLAAAEKAGKLALQHGMEVKIASLPNGFDPADLIQKKPKMFVEALKKSKHIIDFELDVVIATTSDKRLVGKRVREKVLPFIRDLESTIDKSYYVSQIARRLGVREEAIWDDIKSLPDKALSPKETQNQPEKASNPFSISSFSIEKRIMGILYWKPELTKFKEKVIEILGEEKFLEMCDETEATALELAYVAEQHFEDKKIFEIECRELLLSIEKRKLQDEIFVLQDSLHKSEGDTTDEIMRKIQSGSKRIEEIKKELNSKF